jgi:sialidase-1
VDNLITVDKTGLVYSNPKPHLRSVVAYHPSLSLISDCEFLATFDIGQAVESFDYHTVVARSRNKGESWELEGPVVRDPPPMTTHSVRTSRCPDGLLVGFGGFYRRNLEEDLVNRKTFGLVPVDLFTTKSSDGGRSWTAPKIIEPPLSGPSWEICHPIVVVDDETWLAPTSTWRGWEGRSHAGEQAVVLITRDKGESWSNYGVSFDGLRSELTYLEQSVTKLRNDSLLAVSWVYDLKRGTTKPSVFSISSDRGATFTEPRLTGFQAQTCKVIQLFDGRILCVYRRNDAAGLWATLASLEDGWTNLNDILLWQGAESGMKGTSNSADELSDLKFGHPSIRQISSEEVLILFWCQEECLTNIRWIKLRLH